MYRVHSMIDLQTVTGRMNFFNPCLQNIPRDFEISIENLFNENCLKVCDSAKSHPGSTDEHDVEASAVFLEKLNDDDDESKPPQPTSATISLRNSFTSRAGCVLLAADYCQLELRIITNLCRDEKLIGVFNDAKTRDVFVLLASQWLGIPAEQVDEPKRQNVKKVIYGIIYGISAKTLAVFLGGLSENEASAFIESFKNTFPALKRYIGKQVETCRAKGYIESIRKRRRYLPNIASVEPRQRAQAERQAVNTIVQGSASDLVKSAMIKIEKALRKKYASLDEEGRGAQLVMQLHDELIYEVNETDLSDVQAIVRDCMENCMDLPVRMKIKMKIGPTWGSLVSV